MEHLIILDKLEGLRLRDWIAEYDKHNKNTGYIGMKHKIIIIDDLETAKKYMENKYG